MVTVGRGPGSCSFEDAPGDSEAPRGVVATGFASLARGSESLHFFHPFVPSARPLTSTERWWESLSACRCGACTAVLAFGNPEVSRSPRSSSSRTDPWDSTVGESSRLVPSLGGAEGGVPPSRSAWQKSAGLEGTSEEGQWPGVGPYRFRGRPMGKEGQTAGGGFTQAALSLWRPAGGDGRYWLRS